MMVLIHRQIQIQWQTIIHQIHRMAHQAETFNKPIHIKQPVRLSDHLWLLTWSTVNRLEWKIIIFLEVFHPETKTNDKKIIMKKC